MIEREVKEIRIRLTQGNRIMECRKGERRRKKMIILSLRVCYMWVTTFEKYYIGREKRKKVFYNLMASFKGIIIIVMVGVVGLRMLIRWEGIGILSYVLIIYLQSRRKSRRGGVNAVISNRIRDAILLVMLYRGIKTDLEEGNISRVRGIIVIMTMIGKSAGGVITS